MAKQKVEYSDKRTMAKVLVAALEDHDDQVAVIMNGEQLNAIIQGLEHTDEFPEFYAGLLTLRKRVFGR